MQKIKSDIYSLSSVPQNEVGENSYYFQNWHIPDYTALLL